MYSHTSNNLQNKQPDIQKFQNLFHNLLFLHKTSEYDQEMSQSQTIHTLVNVYVDLLVFTRIAGTS